MKSEIIEILKALVFLKEESMCTCMIRGEIKVRMTAVYDRLSDDEKILLMRTFIKCKFRDEDGEGVKSKIESNVSHWHNKDYFPPCICANNLGIDGYKGLTRLISAIVEAFIK